MLDESVPSIKWIVCLLTGPGSALILFLVLSTFAALKVSIVGTIQRKNKLVFFVFGSVAG